MPSGRKATYGRAWASKAASSKTTGGSSQRARASSKRLVECKCSRCTTDPSPGCIGHQITIEQHRHHEQSNRTVYENPISANHSMQYQLDPTQTHIPISSSIIMSDSQKSMFAFSAQTTNQPDITCDVPVSSRLAMYPSPLSNFVLNEKLSQEHYNIFLSAVYESSKRNHAEAEGDQFNSVSWLSDEEMPDLCAMMMIRMMNQKK
ncbi:hypothetical protein M422DRAFT_271052 [Sphaerobolus stellatus SS14]|uniref:Uncharacterized protein n=1 Tax=Sphaerobolus stellatus (strain SS14) TaxID=990650 RepID=A0A0C9UFG7_SPHS4|nr:hypothetical protein M422DRAFT_271052 [Sphaerobolus stellatus SS14]